MTLEVADLQWFKFKTVNSKKLDAIINNFGHRSRPEQEMDFYKVPFSDKVMVELYPHFLPYERTLVVTIPYEYSSDLFALLVGKGKLELSLEPFVYFDATVKTVKSKELYAPSHVFIVEIVFIISPFTYLEAGAEILPLKLGTSQFINPGNWPSNPIFYIKADGDFSISSGSQKVEVKGLTGNVVIDSELKLITQDEFNVGDKATGDFIKLQQGEVDLTLDGQITEASMRARWRNV